MMRSTGLMLVAVLVWLPAIPVFAHGDLHERIEECTRRIKASTEPQAMLYSERGELYRLHGDSTNALSDFSRALSVDADLTAARLGLSRVLLDGGKAAESAEVLGPVLAARPNNPTALLLRAQCMRALNQRSSAIADYNRVLELDPRGGPEVYVELADTLTAWGMTGDALRVLDSGIERLGDLASLELKAIELELQRGSNAAALLRLEKRLARQPENAFLLFSRVEILEKERRFAEARTTLALAQAATSRLRPSAATAKLTQSIQDAFKRLDAPNASIH